MLACVHDAVDRPACVVVFPELFLGQASAGDALDRLACVVVFPELFLGPVSAYDVLGHSFVFPWRQFLVDFFVGFLVFAQDEFAAVRLSQACVLPVLAPYVFVDVLHETVAFLAFQFSSYLDSCEVTFLVGFSCSSFNPNILIRVKGRVTCLTCLRVGFVGFLFCSR